MAQKQSFLSVIYYEGGGTMRKKMKSSSHCANWLDTYSDMVTLLLTFFVLLFSMTTMNAEKWKKLVSALQMRNGTAPASAASVDLNNLVLPKTSSSSAKTSAGSSASSSAEKNVNKVTNFDDLYPYFKNYVVKNNLQTQVGIYKGNGYTFLSFRNSIFFSGDSATLQPQGKKLLDFLCDAMSGISNQIGEVRFYGHTAKVSDTNTTERQAFDRGLSSDRAKNVLLYVQSKGIIGGEKMVSEGYGEYRPFVKDDGTEATRAKNRRVEIYISKVGKTQDELQQIYSDINKASGTSSSPSSAGKSPASFSSNSKAP